MTFGNLVRPVIVASLLTMLSASTAFAGTTVVYVDADATMPPFDGSSWCSAYPSLSGALAAVSGPTVIKVAQGTYLPDTTGLANPREATFTVPDGVTLKGGYAGCGEPDPDARDVELYEAVLSGDIGSAEDDDNCYQVVTAVIPDSTVELNGLTITKGYSSNAIFPINIPGAGLYCEFINLTLQDCTVTDNVATNQGGGLYLDSGTLSINGCTFTDNIGQRGGGAIALFNVTDGAITDSRFTGNTSGDTGPASGGGIYMASSDVDLSGCLFRSNFAWFDVGGFDSVNCSQRISNCEFVSCSTDGGAGGMRIGPTSDVEVINCLFANNWGGIAGGGMVNSSPQTEIANCTFVNNGSDSFEGGGGLFTSSDVLVRNCIFWENWTYVAPSPSEDQISGTASVFDSCVQGGFAGTNIISVDPGFVDVDGPDDDPFTYDDNDYRLAAGSPLIDRGDNAAVSTAIITDLDDNPRFRDDPATPDTGSGTPPIVDLGPYEFQPLELPCPWDSTDDGEVGVDDFFALLQNWGPCPAVCPWDSTDDGEVSVDDFFALLQNWGPCP